MKIKADKVVFRVWKDTGDVFALFPDIPADVQGHCVCYQHLGQHGAANYNHCVSKSVPARNKEYMALFNELSSIGYRMDIWFSRGKKRSRDR